MPNLTVNQDENSPRHYSPEPEKENHPRYGHHHDQVDHVFRRPHHSFFFFFSDEFFHHSPFDRSRSGSGNLSFDEWMPVLKNMDRQEDLVIHHSSPGYEINETELDYQICIDVPGVHLKDLNLQLEHYGHVLHVSGRRQIHRDGKLCTAKFEKRFRIGHNIDHDLITAHLSEGVLVVTAPKLKQLEKKPKKIVIHDGDEP